MGQSWLAREGMSSQFLGVRAGPFTLISHRVEMFPFSWQGKEPHLTWHLLPDRGRRVGVPFSIISIHLGCWGWSGGSSGARVPWLNCPGCHSVRIRLAQGCRGEDQSGGHGQELLCPQASNTTPGRPFLHGAVLGSGITQMSDWQGEHPCQPPFPDTTFPWQEFSGSSPKRRRAEDKDEGIGSPDIWEDEKAEDLRREMIELRQQLDKERSVRMMLEEQVRPGALL